MWSFKQAYVIKTNKDKAIERVERMVDEFKSLAESRAREVETESKERLYLLKNRDKTFDWEGGEIWDICNSI